MSDLNPPAPPRAAPLRLAARQKVLLLIIETLWMELGEAPTIRELSARFGVTSQNATWETLRALAKKGWVQLRETATRGADRCLYRVWQASQWPLIEVRCWSGPRDNPVEHVRTLRAPTTTWALQWVVEDWLGVREWARTRQIWRADVSYVDEVTPTTEVQPPAAPPIAEDPVLTDAELAALAVLSKTSETGASIEAVEAYTDMPQVTDRLEAYGMVTAGTVEEQASVALTAKGENMAAAMAPGVVTGVQLAEAIDRDAVELDRALTQAGQPQTTAHAIRWGVLGSTGAGTQFWQGAGLPYRPAHWVQTWLDAVLEAPRRELLLAFVNDGATPLTEVIPESADTMVSWLVQWGLVVRTQRKGAPQELHLTPLGHLLLKADLTEEDEP